MVAMVRIHRYSHRFAPYRTGPKKSVPIINKATIKTRANNVGLIQLLNDRDRPIPLCCCFTCSGVVFLGRQGSPSPPLVFMGLHSAATASRRRFRMPESTDDDPEDCCGRCRISDGSKSTISKNKPVTTAIASNVVGRRLRKPLSMPIPNALRWTFLGSRLCNPQRIIGFSRPIPTTPPRPRRRLRRRPWFRDSDASAPRRHDRRGCPRPPATRRARCRRRRRPRPGRS